MKISNQNPFENFSIECPRCNTNVKIKSAKEVTALNLNNFGCTCPNCSYPIRFTVDNSMQQYIEKQEQRINHCLNIITFLMLIFAIGLLVNIVIGFFQYFNKRWYNSKKSVIIIMADFNLFQYNIFSKISNCKIRILIIIQIIFINNINYILIQIFYLIKNIFPK